jgi:hypothetical protein
MTHFTKQKSQEAFISQAWWLTPVISTTWDMEIGRISVQGQVGQKS